MSQQGTMPPFSLEAERSVLGAMMLGSEPVALALESLKPEDFYVAAHKEIFDAMMALNAAGQPVDLVTLVDELFRRGTLEGAGGAGFISDLSQFVPVTSNVRAYIQIVEERSTLRKLIAASAEISRESYEAIRDVDDIMSDAERAIFDITMRKSGDAFEHINPVLIRAYDQIEQLYINKGAILGVPTGFRDLDRMTTGLHGGELVLIASRPSMGKSTFAQNIIQHAAIRAGKTVALFSLEMPAEQVGNRMLCCEAGVDMQSVRHGTLRDEDWEALAFAMGPLSASNIYIDDSANLNINMVRSKCRRLQIEHGLDMVIIDYMQLMSGVGKTAQNRQQEISEISRSLKILAQELDIPLVALSQLSRSPQGRSDHRPELSDMRDSGAIEQDADVVMFIYRDEYYHPDTEDKNIAEIIIKKQRNGPLGTVKLAWQGHLTRFVDLPEGQGGDAVF